MSKREAVWVGHEGTANTTHVLADCQTHLEMHVLAAHTMLDTVGKSKVEVFEDLVAIKLGAEGPTREQLAIMYAAALITLAEAGEADDRQD